MRVSRRLPVRGLADALFAKTQRRVLGLLFGNPDRSFFANEIVRHAESGIGAVRRELAALEAAGLVTAKRIGNQKHYQANRAAPIFEELRGIVVKTFGVADVLREALAPLAAKIRAAFIYGSIAKGSDTATSDIDLMVISDEVAYADLFGPGMAGPTAARAQSESDGICFRRPAEEAGRWARLRVARIEPAQSIRHRVRR